jgi:putative ABC transport system permease protein
MIRWPGVRRAFRLGRPADVEREVEDELDHHFALEVRDLVAGGLGPDEARREAERRFGDVRATRRRLVKIGHARAGAERRAEWWRALAQDLRYAARGLRLRPGFTLAVVLTLGLGIGANATMFGIVDRLLLRPPAYLAHADRVHRVWFLRTFGGKVYPGVNTSYPRYLDLRSMTTSFDVVAAFIDPSIAIGTGERAREEHVLGVSASYWRLFHIRPVVGRFFTAAENREPTGTPVAVLGYDYWRTRFGGRRDVLDSTLRIGMRDYAVIGVAPPGFMGTSMGAAAAILPITAAVAETGTPANRLRTYSWSWPQVFVRRREGVTVAAATADLTLAYQRSYARQVAEAPGTVPIAIARPHAVAGSVLRDRGPRSSAESRVALWLAGVAAIVLVIACANVGNLLLARAFGRRREIAVRLALGISRLRLLTQLLTESVLLAALGGAAGLAIAQWGGGLLRGLLIPDVDWGSTLGDPRVLVFGAAAALVAGLLAGMAPALHAGRSDVAAALKAGAREGPYHRSRARTALLVVQGALSVLLLVGAGLFLRSFQRVRALPLGYDAGRLLWVAPVMRSVQLADGPAAQLRQRLADRAATVPGVERSARAFSVPFWQSMEWNIVVPGLDTAYTNHLGEGNLLLQAASPGYFGTMGTRIVRGRGFAAGDRAGASLVAVVSRSLAKALWRASDPLGRCIKIGADTAPCRTVVGVAQDIVRSDFRDDPGLAYYIPTAQWRPELDGVFVRTRGPAERYVEAVRRALQGEMPGDAYVDVRSLADIVAPNMRQWDLGATMFTVFGALALVVAAVGLYSVTAYGVAQRTHELGVRVALGAEARDLMRLVMLEAVRLSGIALTLGLVGALTAGRFLAPLLFETSPRDPAILAAVAAVLLATSVVASAVPALRAARVDPNRALRDE